MNIDYCDYYLKATLKCYSKNEDSSKSYLSDGLFSDFNLYPLNYPKSRFSSKTKENEKDIFYFPLKSTKSMSLYQVAIYDNSLSTIESGTNSASIICSFNLDTDKISNFITSSNIYYQVSLGLSYYL